MELTENDVIKFYELLSRYDITSPNIGVIGTKEKFRRYMNEITKTFTDTNVRIISNIEQNTYRFIFDEFEYCYIHIQTIKDLPGRKFRKFI